MAIDFPFLTKNNNKYIFNDKYMEIYIPKNYFKTKTAEQLGAYINTLGVFNFAVFPNGKSPNINDANMYLLKLPLPIMFEYTTVRDENLTLVKGQSTTAYSVFELTEGNIFMDNCVEERSANNTKKFINILHGGNLPISLKYEDISELYLNTILLNDTKLNNPASIFEIVVAELERYKKNINIPFRKMIGKSNSTVSSYDYVNVSLKKLPGLNSTFADVSFENINNAVINGIRRTKTNGKENESPIEKIIKY